MNMLEMLDRLRDYVIYVSPQLVGVIVGGLLIQRYWVQKANESSVIEYLTKELSDLVDETLEYWSIDCSTGDGVAERRREARRLEAKMKGAIHNINSVLGHYANRYCSRSYRKKVDFSALMAEVNNACTGGTFEVAKRPADASRGWAVVNTIHKVKSQLLERRV
jgi:hypothetical protein